MTDTTTAAPTKAYLRFIDDGLTFDGQVWRAGAVCATENIAFVTENDPLTQRRKWGRVQFEVISEDEYVALRDVPAQNLRTVRPLEIAPPPPAMTHSEHGDQTFDPAKAVPVAGQAPQPVAQLLVSDDADKLAKAGVAAVPPPPEPTGSPWDWYDTANDLQTVQNIVQLGESQMGDFLVFERSHRNRPQIIKLIETGEM